MRLDLSSPPVLQKILGSEIFIMPLWKTYMQKVGWRIALTSGKTGTGDWEAFDRSMDDMQAATAKWKAQLQEVERPWLCWSNNEDWCILQQKLVLAVGWTPVVGWDPNCTNDRPKIVEGAIAIDFNQTLGFPAMWPHFPLEFVFMWAPRLAFWHSDLLVRFAKLEKIAQIFEGMNDGELAAVRSFGGMRNWHKYKRHRYWELIGCTTREASRHQFINGCSWWRNFHLHPNTPKGEVEERSKYYREHGVGIMYWKRRYHRSVINISERIVREGHCTRIGNKNYITDDDKGKELTLNFDLRNEARRLGLSDFL
jgi:hypothetical protein